MRNFQGRNVPQGGVGSYGSRTAATIRRRTAVPGTLKGLCAPRFRGGVAIRHTPVTEALLPRFVSQTFRPGRGVSATSEAVWRRVDRTAFSDIGRTAVDTKRRPPA